MIALTFENNEGRWGETVKYYEEENDWGCELRKQRKLESGKVDPDDPLFKAKFTSRHGGQQRYGSFSLEGVKTYKSYCHDVRTYRRDNAEEFLANEIAIHAKLREMHGVKGDAPPKKTKKTSSGRARVEKPNKRRRKEIVTFSESESE